MLSNLLFIFQLLFILSPAPSAGTYFPVRSLQLHILITFMYLAQQGSTDCGKRLGFATLITQSDIDSIADCTTIFGTVQIILQGTHPGPGIGASPTIFTLPSNLQFIESQFYILTAGNYSTTSIVAPNLKTIGYSNSTSQQDYYDVDHQLLIAGGSYTTSFPALTSIQGVFSYANYNLPALNGFPVLNTVGGILFNGSYSSVDLPALVTADSISITSSNPSFQCPSNIATNFNCNITYCAYSPAGTLPAPYNCNPDEPTGTPGNGPTPVVTTSATVDGTATSATKDTGAAKASGALALKCSGNELAVNEANLKDLSNYVV